MKRKKKWNKENRLKLKDIKCSEKSKQDKHKITSQHISGKLLKYLSKQKKKTQSARIQPWDGSGKLEKEIYSQTLEINQMETFKI